MGEERAETKRHQETEGSGGDREEKRRRSETRHVTRRVRTGQGRNVMADQ